MHEIDFQPAWYDEMHRRKRRLRLQFGLSVLVMGVFIAWLMFNNRRIQQGRALLAERQTALAASELRVQQRTVQQQLRDQLRAQDRVESSLGLNVESSRVLALLSTALPEAASVTELSLDTDEHQRPLLQQVISKASAAAAVPERRLNVIVKCVAPANIDVASFLENLANTGVCESLRLDYAKEKVTDNTVMREFQVAFKVNLDSDGDVQ